MKCQQLKTMMLCVILTLASPAFSQNTEPPGNPDFMFIYPTAFGPAIEFRGSTYGTGFGVDAVLARELKEDESFAFLLDSYGNKLFWGNAVFYPGLTFSLWMGLGLPLVGTANLISGSAYEDLSRSVGHYNSGDTDKMAFEIRQFGYKLRWDGVSYDPHDPAVLSELGSDEDARPFVEGYRKKSHDAVVMSWTSLAYPPAGYLLGSFLRIGIMGTPVTLELPGLAIGAAAGLLNWWVFASFEGSSAEADLVQAVRVYNASR